MNSNNANEITLSIHLKTINFLGIKLIIKSVEKVSHCELNKPIKVHKK